MQVDIDYYTKVRSDRSTQSPGVGALQQRPCFQAPDSRFQNAENPHNADTAVPVLRMYGARHSSRSGSVGLLRGRDCL